jgi:cell wall-associated NlpC family hydrolase
MTKHVCKALLLSATLTACTLTAAHGAPKPKPSPKPKTSVVVTPRKVAVTPNPTPAPMPGPPITQYAYGAMKFMRANIGKTYVLGGTGPDIYDCSGLIQAAWKAVGVTLPRTSGQQYDATVRIAYEDLQPGDLVFFGYHGSHHVGMYVGNNQMIDAANPRRGVTFSDLTQSWYKQNLGGYGRIPATDV